MKRGFTLIELIVVIAIIAILAAIIAPNAFKAIEKANISATIEDFRSIKTAAMAYYADAGIWPISGCEEGLTQNTDCSGAVPPADAVGGWDGPYLEKWPSRSRWGAGAYAFVRGAETAVAVGNTDWNASGAAAATTNVRVLTITNMPLNAMQKLENQLDGTATPGATNWLGSVRYDGTLIYLLISTD